MAHFYISIHTYARTKLDFEPSWTSNQAGLRTKLDFEPSWTSNQAEYESSRVRTKLDIESKLASNPSLNRIQADIELKPESNPGLNPPSRAEHLGPRNFDPRNFVPRGNRAKLVSYSRMHEPSWTSNQAEYESSRVRTKLDIELKLASNPSMNRSKPESNPS